MRSMTIAVVCDVPVNEKNGTAVATMNLVNGLKARGHTVRVVCPDEKMRGQPGYYVVPSINFGPLNRYVRKNGVVIARPDKATMRQALEGVDAVHVIIPFFLAYCAIHIAQELGIPVTAGFHCQAENLSNHLFLMNARAVNRLVYKIFYRYIYSRVDCIHYPTQFIRDVFETQIGRKTNGRVISNGVNSEFIRCRGPKPPEYADRYVILFTGRYSKEKSHRVLVNGVRRSKHAGQIQLIFAGDGPRKRWLKHYCKRRLPVQPVFGFFKRSELVRIINYADLYVHPAEIELEGIACLEALKCGLVPVLSDSKRSATRFFARDERNLFACNDSRDLAAKIDYWLENPIQWQACSDAYAEHAAQLSLERCMDEMEQMICSNVRLERDA